MRKKDLNKQIHSLQTSLGIAKGSLEFWKNYTEFLQEKLSELKEKALNHEQVINENEELKKLVAEVTSDLNALRRSSGFAHAYCAYDGWLDKEYCDRCRENGYNDWKWRGVLKNEENH